jgi:hypothetical protein
MRRLIIGALALSLATPALAGDEWVPPVAEPLTRKECGACHMAFQPAFLPARSWARMMDGLADHFGEDASLSSETARTIRGYLMQNAGDSAAGGLARVYMRWVKPDGAPLRITENPAFLREHRFRPEVWRRPEVVTASNCPACHRAAEVGLYED